MNERTADLWQAAAESDKTPAELQADLAELNEDLDWCYAEMIDHVEPADCGCSVHGDTDD